MSKWDKLIEKILALSSDLRFDELKKVLEDLNEQKNYSCFGLCPR